MATNGQIERAVAHLKAQKDPNISATARELGVERRTLSNRFRGKTVSHEEATSSA
ncbi:hypothetical protein GJ744_004646 [Endocarpon pusillum]|uniref:Uncharacterized protein n=1 Tax=Endocarpon pusillum TaxID=364733 RepID=A0A8H7ANU1_9EURO|nr:hypothetical protein GJ744_004646 [Endocarpon pusillum]